MTIHDAILLLGPTGSGKTPLGDLMEQRGLWGRQCVHFDFGRELRRVAEGDPSDRAAHRLHATERRPALLAREEVEFVRRVLKTGALLEDKDFPIARKILTAFIERAERSTGSVDDVDVGSDAEVLVVLNGLPRHLGQAAEVDGILDVRAVIHLHCAADVVLARIRTNAGGDRADRADDGLDSVRTKLELFEQRTKPLIQHYEASGARIIEVKIAADTTAPSVLAALGDESR